MNKIGFHISSAAGANSEWIGRFKSEVHLVLAVGVGGEIPRLLNLAQAHPDSRFIYRAWTYGNLGQSDHFESYFKVHGTDPLPLIEAHEPVFEAASAYNNRISYQLWNETGHDEATWPHFIEFNTRFIQEMDRRGLSAAVLGLGPGHPAWSGGRDGIRRAWVQARPLFEAIIGAQQMHVVNLHEYHALPYTRFYPWIIGRYQMMLEDIRLMGLPTDKVKVVIGESGFTDPNALNMSSPPGPNGYRWSLAQGATQEQLAEDYAAMIRAVYQDSPNLLGLNYFCLGDSGGWAEFDLLQEPRILQRLYEIEKEPPVEITVIETPVTAYQVAHGPLNIRQTPSTSAEKIGTLAVGVTVQTNGYVEADGIRWRRLSEQTGYCAEIALSVSSAPFLTIVTTPDWKVGVLAQIEAIRAQLAQLEAAIQAA